MTAEMEVDDVLAVQGWLSARTTVDGTLRATLIAGGKSNLTYRIEDDGGRAWVLRRPPHGELLATAHDMAREFKIITLLGPTSVPVPGTVGLCEDPEVIGAPFFVAEFVEGTVVRGVEEAALLPVPVRRAAGEAAIDTLVAIHAVDVDAVGLGDLGRRDGYVERQLKRWLRQHEQVKHPLALLEDVHRELAAKVPAQRATALVHGDFRLDNMIIGSGGEVRAVLDWELCTIGDPLADVGLLQVYWADIDDEGDGLLGSPTTAPGFPTASELAARYAEATGFDLAEMPFYVTLGYWKLACIFEGVRDRYRAGSVGGDPVGADELDHLVVALAQRAADHLAAG